MQDKVILGLLAHEDLSMYQLKKIMEQSTSLFFSATTGSLHPALKKLQAAGLITCREESHGKRTKKLYSRTQAGAQVFQNWISEPVANLKVKDEGLLRLYFSGHIEQEIEPYLQLFINEAKGLLEVLEPLYFYHKQQTVAAKYAKQVFFELATLKYGIDNLKFAIDWYQQLILEYRVAEFV